jgi:hypothetical protein
VDNLQHSSDLLAAGPAELLDRPLDDYAAVLRQSDELHRDHLAAIDYALRHTVVRLLVRAAPEAELSEAYGALRRLVPVAREAELADWVPRWRAFADLLDARRAALAAQDPEAARRLMHSGSILDLVESDPGLTQAEIAQRLGLKPANLSRILGVLEAHELIERRSTGREKRVHPGRLAVAAGRAAVGGPADQRSAADGPVAAESEVRRGRSYLYQPAPRAA